MGLFVASQFWTGLSNEELIVYHNYLKEGLHKLFGLEEYKDNSIESIEDYIKLNDHCKRIKTEFGFRDLTEVHVFLWDYVKYNGNYEDCDRV